MWGRGLAIAWVVLSSACGDPGDSDHPRDPGPPAFCIADSSTDRDELASCSAILLPQMDRRPASPDHAVCTVGRRLNGSGVIIGTTCEDQGFIWSPDQPAGTLLLPQAPLPPGEVTPLGINDAGDVVGFFSSSAPAGYAAFRLSAGEFSELPMFGDERANVAAAIDDQGTIVGRAQFGSGGVAVIWEDGEVRRITDGVLDGHQDGATAMSRNGTVIGYTDTDTLFPSAFRWRRPGAIELLPTVDGAETGATDVNDAGVMVGYAGVEKPQVALTWDEDGDVHELPGLHEASGTVAFGINNRGVIVGEEATTEFSDSSGARVWLDGEVHQLQELSPAVPEEYRLMIASDVNDSDEVVATAALDDGGPLRTVTFLLRLDL